MIDTDHQDPTLPTGYSTCSECHRLVYARDLDMDGHCSTCVDNHKPPKLAPNPIVEQSPEDQMRDTVPAMGTVDNGQPGSATTLPSGATRGIDDPPGGNPGPRKKKVG